MILANNGKAPHYPLFVCLLLLIAWLPLPVGSDRPLGTGLLQMASFGLLCCWCLAQLRSDGSSLAHIGNRSWAALILFVASLLYMLLQIVPLPLSVIGYLSPGAYAVYERTQPYLYRSSFSISLDIGLTLSEFLKSAAYLVIFFLVLALVSTRQRLRQLIYLMIMVGFAEAAFGLLDALYNGALFRQPVIELPAGHTVSGTFKNRNHFGGMLEMSIALTIGTLVAQESGRGYAFSWRQQLRSAADWLLSKQMWLYLALATMITALLSSASRGATLSLLAAGLATGAILVVRGAGAGSGRRRSSRRRKLRPVILLPLVLGLSLGGSQMLSRLEQSGLKTDRDVQRAIAYEMIADYPLFGVGAGNWVQIYPAYRDADQYYRRIYTNVHNDYLELIAEQGLVGFGLFGGAVLIVLKATISGLLQRRDPFMRGVLLGCTMATLSLLIHSMADFNLHVPANAAWFSVLLAMGMAAARMPREA
ncbi:MAG: O-antigen ligase family protein [Parahaliea sp.]